MNAKVFVDSSVLVYSRDSTEMDKQERAHHWLAELWQRRQGCLSFQVLQEFYVTVTCKLDPGMSRTEALADIRALLSWSPVAVDPVLFEIAWRFEERFRTSWWDSLIIAAAHAAQARYLLTEDLQDEMDFDGVTVVNPFRRTYAELK